MDFDDIHPLTAIVVIIGIVLFFGHVECQPSAQISVQSTAAEAPKPPTQTAEAPEPPAAPTKTPAARKAHQENAAGQSMEVVDSNVFPDWFQRHLDFKIEHITSNNNYQMIVIFSKIDKSLKPEAEPGR